MFLKYPSAPPGHQTLARLLVLALCWGLLSSCAATPVKLPQATYYVTPPITYLQEKPAYGGNILGPLYRGDKVKVVGSEPDWWQVTLWRSGQTGWVQKELLSPKPLPTMFYYVKMDSQPLLECPRLDCLPIQMLFRGAEVQKIAAGPKGWWRVLVPKSHSVGWMPTHTLTHRIEAARQSRGTLYYYVAVRRLGLRAIPTEHSPPFRTLKFNEQVAKIAETKDWFKVRQPQSGAVGWVKSRGLSSLPSIYPRGERPGPKKVRPFKPREEPAVEPEFM